MGDVLGTFLGGVNQSIDPAGRDPVHSIGGWVEFWAYLTDQMHAHVGYGIDNPRDSDLTFSPTGRRSRNQFYFGNVTYDVTPNFVVGLELSWWETNYIGLDAGNSFRVEAVVKYQF